MDLSRIVLHSVRADKAREIVSSLEELPNETIKRIGIGSDHPDKIQAFEDPYHEKCIQLDVPYRPEQMPGSIIFLAPSAAKIINKNEERMEFEYKEILYKLRRILVTY